MQETLTAIVGDLGYFGIAILIFIENIFPPIPSEAVLLFGGFMTVSAGLNPWLVILAATIGSMLGALALYAAGYFLGKERIKRFCAGKFGRILHIKADTIDSADEKFKKYGGRAVLICRCVPIVRSVISVPAGLSKMPPVRFFSLTFIGSAVWNSALVWAGAAAGSAWESCIGYFDIYTKIAVIALIAAAAIAAFILIKKKRRARRGFTEE